MLGISAVGVAVVSTTRMRYEQPFSSIRQRWVLLIFASALFATAVVANEEGDICVGKSCYPATGNLLIGRKNDLHATSTCGLRQREQYCIVSHLEDERKCFHCDSRHPWSPENRFSHRIENVVNENYEDRTRNWWQSENGVQNVSIRFDLKAEFHFTHLIMTFRSFRPAAMYIERSADFGRTWSVYRYFAYDCNSMFPGISDGPPKSHSDVICTRKYSDVAPSTGGELVYKVISPHIPTDDPYAPDIAKLLKITNLRITFVKLHTLGDDLLDYRPEIDEKYYYAVYELVVRGSCSCYGHAQRCIPDSKDDGAVYPPDMVHGRCECTHHTKGVNCDECQDFYHDLPWLPAIGDQSNECKRCECNGHASRCHFDEAVYNASGFTSGGVCDDCMHNTQGKNCEQCRTYFYRDPSRPIHDPYVCRPCDCNKAGSQSDGICEGEEDPKRGLVAGKCYCKTHVIGASCDRCENGYWDLQESDPDGCKKCTCDIHGTINNEGCDKTEGTCACKRLVTGENCDRCLPKHYGLSDDPDGCKSCNCDLGGSLSDDCDVKTGQCTCRENFSGLRCNVTESGYFCPNIDYFTFDAENVVDDHAEFRGTQSGDQPTFTGRGFAKVTEGFNLTFNVNAIRPSGLYNIVFRYELPDQQYAWEDVKISVVRSRDPQPDGPCANSLPSDDFLIARLFPGYRYTEVTPTVCLEQGVDYEIRVYFGERRIGVPNKSAYALIDSIIIVPPTDSLDVFKGSPEAEYRKQVYERYQCRPLTLQLVPQNRLSSECLPFICLVAGLVHEEAKSCDCDLTGSVSGICDQNGGQCECKPNVIGRRCDKCKGATYGFGPSGCTPCHCDSEGSLESNCDLVSGQCKCSERGITGLQCNECQRGFWRFPECLTCQCNGHASSCDQKTGACIECQNLTAGMHCETCVSGFYGDPRLGYNLPCKACPCPGGPGSGFQHADTCHLRPGSSDVVCNCRSGYTGERCDKCQINYWGNPTEVGGSCEICDCNGNIDRNMPDSCDALSGDCLKCLYNTEGLQCELCKSGFFGEAKIRSCQRCVCNHLGTDTNMGECDRFTGQCPCFPNVVGMKCDECAPLHYNFSSGKGCLACGCDPNGVVIDQRINEQYLQCNNIDGQCHCKPGRGGRTCSECQDFYWGDPVHGECKRCECDPHGSETLQCNRSDGTCVCRPGSGGPLCNQCARGYTGIWPHCKTCGECFDNWDRILQELKKDLDGLIHRANNIEDTGISSEYDASFEAMESQIAEIKGKLEGVNITKADVDKLRDSITDLQTQIDDAREKLVERNQRVTRIQTNVDIAQSDIRSLNNSARTLTSLADKLHQDAIKIRMSNTKGAYELVRESSDKSADSQRTIMQEVSKIAASESDRLKAELLLNEHQTDFNIHYGENENKLKDIGVTISKLEATLPHLNKEVCGAESATCDAMCGGPGSQCSHCGGTSCPGSVSKAEQAREFANEASEKVLAKQKEAEELLKRLRESRTDIEATKRESEEALRLAKVEVEKANHTKLLLEKQINETKAFIESDKANADDIQAKINAILAISIPFNEQKVQELSQNIRQKVSETKDTDKILEDTRDNKTIALRLQKSAEDVLNRASQIHNLTDVIRNTLNEAQKAQDDATETLTRINDNIEKAKNGLTSTEEEVAQLESRANEVAERIHAMHTLTDNLKAEYIKITSNSKSATASANSASELVKMIEDKHSGIREMYDKVVKLLEDRESGNEERKNRAEELRRRTTNLLAKINRSREEKNSLIERADSLDVELEEFRTSIDTLGEQIDQVSTEIGRSVEYHSTCDA